MQGQALCLGPACACALLLVSSRNLYPDRQLDFHHSYVEFLDGLSQGCPSGSPLTMLALYLAMHITLSKHPDLKVRILSIVDDLDLLGTI